MSNLYQTTTESIESLDKWPSCAPPLPCKKRNRMDEGQGRRSNFRMEDVQQGSSGENGQTDKKTSHRYIYQNATVLSSCVCEFDT